MPDNVPQSELEWLVIFLIYNNSYYDKDFKNVDGYISMEMQKNSVFNAIKDSPNGNQIKVVMIESRFYDGKIVTHVVEKVHTAFKEIPKPNNGTDPTAMASEGSIEDLLRKVKSIYKANRHIIVTFGHGSIFGINFTSTDAKEIVVQKSLFELNKDQKDYLKSIPKISPPSEKDAWFIETTSDYNTHIEAIKNIDFIDFDLTDTIKISMLSNNELARAIKTAFDYKKLDILVMYNCLMQNINTQFELRQSVDYLVAPLSGIGHPGYNYIGVLSEIVANPNLSNKEVSKMFCSNDIVRSHRRYRLFENQIEGRLYLNVIKLEEDLYNELKGEFKSFINEILDLKKSNDQVFRCLNDTINQLCGYNQYSIPDAKVVDFHVFLLQLKKKSLNNPDLHSLLTPIDRLIKLLSRVDNECFCGKNFYQENKFFVDQKMDIKKGFGFLIPKTPTRKKLFDKLFEKKTPQIAALPYTPSLWSDTSYIEFIQQYQSWNGDFF